MITLLMIAGVIIAGSVGDILVSKGMKQVGEIHSLTPKIIFSTIKLAITNIPLLSGIGCMAVAFFSLLAALSLAPLSLVEPATAISYVLNTLGAKFYLKENIDKKRWIGTLLVCTGAALLSLSDTK